MAKNKDAGYHKVDFEKIERVRRDIKEATDIKTKEQFALACKTNLLPNGVSYNSYLLYGKIKKAPPEFLRGVADLGNKHLGGSRTLFDFIVE